MENGLYMIIDYYPAVEGQPMICIIQLDEGVLAENQKRIQLPEYLVVDREITDLPEFQPKSLAKKVNSSGSTMDVTAALEEKKQSSGDELK